MPVAETEPCTLTAVEDLVADLHQKCAQDFLPEEAPQPGPQSDQPDRLEPSEPRPILRFAAWISPLASFLGAGYMVWLASLVPNLDRFPLPSLIAESIEYALLAWALYAAFTLGLYLVRLLEIPKAAALGVIPFAMRTSVTAVWLAPAMILLSAFSVGALAAGLVLVAGITRLLYFHWRLIYRAEQQPEYVDAQPYGLFGTLPAPVIFERLTSRLAVSFAVQAGVLAILMGYLLTAATLFAMATAALTLIATLVGAWPGRRATTLPRSIWDVLLAVALAAALTVVGLTPRLQVNPEARWDHRQEPRPGLLNSTRAFLGAVLYDEQAKATDEIVTPVYNPPTESAEISDSSFPGVILWPEVKPHTLLVAPMPEPFGNGLFDSTPVNPLSIPFSGEYWMYKRPYARPPQNSMMRRGNPSAVAFYTSDHVPMFMEAHHRFSELIDLRCCGAIQVAITNADRFPGTVALELTLINTKLKRQLSLGRANVISKPRVGFWNEPFAPVTEMLNFPVPAGVPLRDFDEIKVVFHRDTMRIDRSAKISIERFLFVPRGR